MNPMRRAILAAAVTFCVAAASPAYTESSPSQASLEGTTAKPESIEGVWLGTLQVPAKQNLPAIEQVLRDAGNKRVTIKELPGLNHLFQTARTGAFDEYARIEETVSPLALETIAGWIAGQAR